MSVNKIVSNRTKLFRIEQNMFKKEHKGSRFSQTVFLLLCMALSLMSFYGLLCSLVLQFRGFALVVSYCLFYRPNVLRT